MSLLHRCEASLTPGCIPQGPFGLYLTPTSTVKHQSLKDVVSVMMQPQDIKVPVPTKPQVEFLFKIIARYDSYIASTNTKASLIIAWNGVILGFVFLKYDSILSQYRQEGWIIACAVALVSLVGFASIVSIFLIFRAISPFMQGKRDEANRGSATPESVIFFGSVASMNPVEYASALSRRTEEELLHDLAEQTCILADGLKKKMQQTRQSVFAIYSGLVCLSSLLLLKALTN